MDGQFQQFLKVVTKYSFKCGIKKVEFEQQKERMHVSVIRAFAVGGINHRKANQVLQHNRRGEKEWEKKGF